MITERKRHFRMNAIDSLRSIIRNIEEINDKKIL